MTSLVSILQTHCLLARAYVREGSFCLKSGFPAWLPSGIRRFGETALLFPFTTNRQHCVRLFFRPALSGWVCSETEGVPKLIMNARHLRLAFRYLSFWVSLSGVPERETKPTRVHRSVGHFSSSTRPGMDARLSPRDRALEMIRVLVARRR